MTSSWLGFKDVEINPVSSSKAVDQSETSDEEPPLTSEDSFIGGIPIIPADISLKEADVQCGTPGCAAVLSCLCQLYCPLDSHPQMHRSVVVLVCSKVDCHQSVNGWKVFRLQWEVKDALTESSKRKSGENGIFEQQDDWGTGDDDWGVGAPSPPKKAHIEENVKITDGVQFEALLETYLVEFEAEDLSKIDDKNIDLEEDTESDVETKVENVKLSDLPEECQKVAKDAFTKFYHRISTEPEQIIRYGGMGEYLPVYSDDLNLPRKCSKCKGALICELQVLPSIHSSFKDSPLTHCSLGVFTCPNTTTCSLFESNCLNVSNLVLEIEKD